MQGTCSPHSRHQWAYDMLLEIQLYAHMNSLDQVVRHLDTAVVTLAERIVCEERIGCDTRPEYYPYLAFHSTEIASHDNVVAFPGPWCGRYLPEQRQ
jgi:hypothetical protein